MSDRAFSAFELTSFERDGLERAGRYGVPKYNQYRKRGLTKFAAIRAAIAWAGNAEEQAGRRCEHETGATRDGRML